MTENPSAQKQPGEMSLEDLYRDWLGVTSPSPTYYDLLGVPPLERDATRILQAAREVKRKIRAYQIGRYRKQALGLLSDVGQAVSVLTNAAKRRVYDNDLMRGWRKTIETLYDGHCANRSHEPETLEAWLIACRESGVPVSRLIPTIMRFLRPRMDSWPARGEHGLNLPKGLWIYRDAVVLGSCLDDIPLERRIEAVKGLQKALGIPEGLARVVAEEVTQESRLLDRMSLVRQAQGDPEGTVLRMGWRIKRLGGRPDDQRSKILSSVGALVGLDRRRIRVLLPRLDERPAVLPASRRAALAARTVGRRAHETGRQVRGWLGLAWAWLADRPQLLVAAAVLSGLVVLVLAVLVVAGVWKPWGPSTESEVAPPIESPPPPTELPAPPEGPDESPPSGLEEWKEFMKKYPVEPGAVPPTPPSVPAQDREEPSADE
ncbi:MAG TPA: hypothetical protein VMW52_04895 [Phycisphaerae bacterium]|nr:hypothetical protein [Phycisphaerae bacterium]